jgi:hypothetical protein
LLKKKKKKRREPLLQESRLDDRCVDLKRKRKRKRRDLFWF